MNTKTGSPFPLGATIKDSGVNFSLFSSAATKVTLCLKKKNEELEIILDPKKNRTDTIWHIFVKDLSYPLLYAYKIDGPQKKGHFFCPDYYVTDPYAKRIYSFTKWGKCKKYQPFGLLEENKEFDWQNIFPPKIPMQDLIIYEMHVRGFTQDPSSRVSYPGTFSGIIEKIPYLLDFGINAVELMPIQEFHESGYSKPNSSLCNYWGYSTVNYFSPMNRYTTGIQDSITEFKTLVRELHRNKIEVILDIVFNHSPEYQEGKGIYSFMGIDFSTYYMLYEGKHCNYSGCGNTLNLNHPVMRKFILDCLRYWAIDMQVDGFRFDLAAIMNRDQQGQLQDCSDLIKEISQDPELCDIKFIAEPWDLAGFQLGKFDYPKNRWSEWNSTYRDSVRDFIRGEKNTKKAFAQKLIGSQELFSQRSSLASINFITCHDGFTLTDLVSFNTKHNKQNKEENQDGNPFNHSWNCGIEGKTKDPVILKLREKQKKNFMVALFLSKGIPMVFMGDEYGHTKDGNNNTWCQDNKLNWFQWDKHSPLYNFMKKMLQFRKEHALLTNPSFYSHKDIIWHGVYPEDPKWEDSFSFLAFSLIDPHKTHLYVAFNATKNPLEIFLPKLCLNKQWHQIVNTDKNPPDDFIQKGLPLTENTYLLSPFSSLLLKVL